MIKENNNSTNSIKENTGTVKMFDTDRYKKITEKLQKMNERDRKKFFLFVQHLNNSDHMPREKLTQSKLKELDEMIEKQLKLEEEQQALEIR